MDSFLRAKLELRGTDNVQGQISKHIFAPNGGKKIWWIINYDNNEAHNMPSALWQGVEKNNTLCDNFQWENASIMQKTTELCRQISTVDKTDNKAFWMHRTTAKQKAPRSLKHNLSSLHNEQQKMHNIFTNFDTCLIFSEYFFWQEFFHLHSFSIAF